MLSRAITLEPTIFGTYQDIKYDSNKGRTFSKNAIVTLKWLLHLIQH